MFDKSATINTTIQDILEKSMSERISAKEARTLLESNQLSYLGYYAYNKMKQVCYPYITYGINTNFNYTNICNTYCTFCAFYRTAKDKDSYTLSRDQIYKKIQHCIANNGKQILLQGGHNPELGIEYFESLLQDIKSKFNIHIHGFSSSEIYHVAKTSNISIKETLQRLMSSGLDSMPGGGAEILVDEVRKRVSPLKITSDQWLQVHETAHNLGLKTTCTMMYNLGESLKQRIEHIEKLRKLEDKSPGFTAFIPWDYIPDNTRLGGKRALPLEYFNLVSVARLFLDNITNIQGPWVTLGNDFAQLAIFYGVNDYGYTMFEENVVAATGTNFKMTEQKIIESIKQTGHVPAERDTLYNILKVID